MYDQRTRAQKSDPDDPRAIECVAALIPALIKIREFAPLKERKPSESPPGRREHLPGIRLAQSEFRSDPPMSLMPAPTDHRSRFESPDGGGYCTRTSEQRMWRVFVPLAARGVSFQRDEDTGMVTEGIPRKVRLEGNHQGISQPQHRQSDTDPGGKSEASVRPFLR